MSTGLVRDRYGHHSPNFLKSCLGRTMRSRRTHRDYEAEQSLPSGGRADRLGESHLDSEKAIYMAEFLGIYIALLQDDDVRDRALDDTMRLIEQVRRQNEHRPDKPRALATN
jgi:hypothetical protein